MYIDLAEATDSWRAMHRLILSVVRPRPIAPAAAVGDDGDLTCDPPRLLAIGHMGGLCYGRQSDHFLLESIREPADPQARDSSRLRG